VKKIVKISEIAATLNLQPVEKTLPNGKTVKSIEWSPSHLTAVYDVCNKMREDSGLGKNDVVVIDGGCPTWLLPTVSHAFHPTMTAVAYPQGGPDAALPLSGAQCEGTGTAANVSFKVTEDENETTVEFSLSAPSIDAAKTLASLVAPAVQNGKAVKITGRGPIAIACALAEAYAHTVPAVYCFQPGTGFVCCISHSSTALGTVLNRDAPATLSSPTGW